MTTIEPISPTGNSYVDSLLGNLVSEGLAYKWTSTGGVTTLTFSFPTGSAHFDQAEYPAGSEFYKWYALSATQRQSVREALAEWSDVANIRFIEVADGESYGDLRFAGTGNSKYPGTGAYAYLPSMSQRAGDVWFPADTLNKPWKPGTWGYYTLMHEIGHAIGLGHPHDNSMPPDRDVVWATIMSYRDNVGDPITTLELSQYPLSPMFYDVLAVQYLYGVNSATRLGNDVYTFDSLRGYDYSLSSALQTLWDAGGVDKIDASSRTVSVSIDLAQGAWVSLGGSFTANGGLNGFGGDVLIGPSVLIENAAGGSSHDTLCGNGLANELSGNGGNDDIYGEGGDDLLIGGGGHDTLTGGGGRDTIFPGSGDDFIDGGAEIDTAIYPNLRAGFAITRDGSAARVSDARGAEGVDFLIDVERLAFADRNVALDIESIGGQAYRLYQAAFARTPDLAGVGYWIAQIDAGATLFNVSTGFIQSAEFKSKYGQNPTNQQYTLALYTNVLHRAPDLAGFDYWNKALSGDPSVGQTTRQQMLIDFSESGENQANVIGVIGNGFDYIAWG